jgi:undecaprenyl-diphosphatase
MLYLHSIVLGLVEGITEFLPISSTGHLILASTLLGIEHTDFHKTFEIVIQLGAIAAVLLLYWRDFLNIEIVKRIAVAFVPTAIVGLLLYKTIKTYLIGNEVVVLWALFVGGVLLLLLEYFHVERDTHKGSIAEVSYKQAVWIGIFQAFAIVPGVSRSAATISGGLLGGLKRKTIVEFSFLLAVPTMLAASGLDLVKTSATFNIVEVGALAVGFIVAFVVALFAMRFLLAYVRTHSFVPFALYRIALAILFYFFIIR